MVMSNVAVSTDANGNSFFTASDAFKQLDPSEKGAASFFIAGAFTKVVSEAFLIPALYHLDTMHHYLPSHGPALPTVSMLTASKQRPDFIGPNFFNRYGVFESKGRTHYSDDALRIKAKEQTCMIDKIEGNDPSCRIACVTNLGTKRITVDVIDPTSPLKEAFSLDLKDSDAKEPFRLSDSFLKQSETHHFQVPQGQRYEVATIEEADLTFGLAEEMVKVVRTESNDVMKKAVLARSPQEEVSFPRGVSEALGGNTEDNFAVGLDGHIVILGKTWPKGKIRG